MAGRSSFIAVEAGPTQRLKPPPGMGERQRAHFIALVAACPAGKFERSDLPLLCRYVELVVICEDAAKQIEADGMVDVEGAPSAWTKIHLAASKIWPRWRCACSFVPARVRRRLQRFRLRRCRPMK